jgi:hypothetical protein
VDRCSRRTPSRRSRRATLFETAEGLEPMKRAALENEPESTVRTNATRPAVFSRIVVIQEFQAQKL